MTSPSAKSARRVLLLGATGTIGRATAAELVTRGYDVTCPVRPRAGPGGRLSTAESAALLPDVRLLFGEVSDPDWLAAEVFHEPGFDAIVSCLASRSGEPADAWAVDFRLHRDILQLAQRAGVRQMILLSAICVQKPRLAFQHAKLAFENLLMQSDMTWSIVRPTAYFKSLSGQVGRLRDGKPFLLFGNGELTACKPISDTDLATYLVDCLEDASRHDRILPIGGPGPAITPRRQGELLFELLGRKPRFRSVPPGLLGKIANLLGGLGRLIPPLAAKAELARIGHYYATESMLVYDPKTGRYDAEATPETGQDSLRDFYRRLLDGTETVERGDHAVFRDSAERS